jgi:WD repeat-containing protein 6
LYDLEFGKIMKSFSVFDGIRVHGIASSFESVIVVFGEKRVKMFRFSFENDEFGSPQLTLIHLLPKFGHWVLDVCFLKVNNIHSYLHSCMSCQNKRIIWMINAIQIHV